MLNEVLLKSVILDNPSINSKENIKTSMYPHLTNSEETTIIEEGNEIIDYLNNSHHPSENKSINDKSSLIITEPIVNPITSNLEEGDNQFIKTQLQENIDITKEISVFSPSEAKEIENFQNINEINGYFIKNKGQIGNNQVRFYIQGDGVWFIDDGVVFELKDNYELRDIGSKVEYQEVELLMNPRAGFEPQEPMEYCSIVLKLKFSGANLVTPIGKEKLTWNNNYFYGNDSTKWCTEVPNYKEIVYYNLYENIDLRYYITEKGLKYDFIVHPGGNPNEIMMSIDGINGLFIDKKGDLNIKTYFKNVIDSDLKIFQEFENIEHYIEGRFKIFNSSTYGFELLDEYNKNYTLIIDPVLNYSSYVGGSNEELCWDIAIDSSANAYVTGYTYSSDFPTTLGAYNRTYCNSTDVFLFKLNPNGSSLVYSTYFGGNGSEWAEGITVDFYGNSYITGMTSSYNFPITSGALDTSYNGGDFDVFLLKLNPNGSSLNYSTFIGGKDLDKAYGITIDSIGSIYIAGETNSSNFPISSSAFDSTYKKWDGYVVKVNSIGSKIIYSTYIGGIKNDVCYNIITDRAGNAYITGWTNSNDFPNTTGSFDTTFNGGTDGFILKLNKRGTKINYSTFIGGSQNDYSYGISLDEDNNAFITGLSESSDFPTSSGAFDSSYNGFLDVFVLKLKGNGSDIMYSTFVGSNRDEIGYDIEVDNNGNAYITGLTGSTNFPTTIGAYDTTYNGLFDVFIIELNPEGSKLNYSSFIGGTHYERCFGIEIDSTSNVFIAGHTYSIDFPTTKMAYDTSFNGIQDCFVTKLYLGPINNPPILNSFTAIRTPEGSKVIFSVNATDPDNDTLIYSFDFQADGNYDLSGKNNTALYVWFDDYDGIATVNISDGNLFVEANTSIFVYNVAPEVYAGINLSINEWQTTNFSANFFDPGSLDTHFIQWDFGDGNKTSGSLNTSHLYTQPGEYIVTLTIIDDDGGLGIDNLTINVLNIKPTVNAGNDIIVNEGDSFNFNGSINNPGHDILLYFWDFDISIDGLDADTIGDNDLDSIFLNTSHVYMDNGSYMAKLTVKDDDNSIVVDYVNITVYDLAPTANFTWSPQPQNEGSPVTFNDSSTSYPDNIVSWLWEFGDWNSSNLQNPRHTYQDNGLYNVNLTISDDDGSHNFMIYKIIIQNVAPIVDAGEDKSIDEGTMLNFNGSFTDPGIYDTHTYEWDFDYNNTTFDVDASGQYVSYVWKDDHIGYVALRITDNDGGWGIDTCQVIVRNVAPSITLRALPTITNISIRIAGEKWHDIKVELYEDDIIILNGNLTRYPGSPNDQMLKLASIELNISKTYSIIIRYSPENDPINGQTNGATPCWIIIDTRSKNGQQLSHSKLHHTFNVKQPRSYLWEVNLSREININTLTFECIATDPGADDLTFYWDFGDGTNIEKYFSNLNKEFPMVIIDRVNHTYQNSGLYKINLIIKDDDGSISKISVVVRYTSL
jgi:PKD repeat protein